MLVNHIPHGVTGCPTAVGEFCARRLVKWDLPLSTICRTPNHLWGEIHNQSSVPPRERVPKGKNCAALFGAVRVWGFKCEAEPCSRGNDGFTFEFVFLEAKHETKVPYA